MLRQGLQSVFIKLFSSAANSIVLDRVPAPGWGYITYSGVTLSNNRTWVALGLVLSAHLAAFATLGPQPLPLLPEPEPEALTVSLLSAPQATPQMPKPPVKPTPKEEKKLNLRL
jgi:periplasmic protein TonB